MYATRILPRIRALHRLHTVSLELTYACNLDCFFCYNNRKKKGKYLTLREYDKILRDLADMQTMFLMLTGGEPMLHPHFFAIGRISRAYGFVVRLRTNGHLLNDANVRRIQTEIQPYAIEVSLHGATAAVHDRQTRTPGSFDQLIANIKTVKKRGLRCACVTTPTAWNEHQITAMFSLCDQLQIPLKFQGPVGPRDNGDTTPLTIQPARSTWDIIERIQKQRRGLLPAEPTDQQPDNQITPATCGVGCTGVDIDPFGNVQACVHLQEAAGNLHEQSIKEIWEHSPLFQKMRQRAIAAGRRIAGHRPRQFGAPLYCLGVEDNCHKPGTTSCP